ncbi:MAG: T9SS type A sorting domain-containing protein [Chitinophagaceae bacterium]|nr:T9SS type A sorting domain-containing protein [Chitinophagaceae bacterium]
MKTVLLLLAGLLPAWAGAQITLTRADFPKPTSSSPLPDSVLYTNVNGNTATAHTINGVNISWDESALSGTTAYQQFLPMSSTPLIFQLLFLSCDYAQPLLNSNFGGNILSDAYEYYDYASSNSRLQVKGFGGNILIPGQTVAVPLPALYSSPDIIYEFPLAYGNKDSCVSGFDVSVPLGGIIGNIQLKRSQKRVNEVDAWGRMTTPSGTYDVLRHVSNIERIDSLITGIFPIGIPSNPVEYRWLAPGMKIPVLQINGTQIGNNFNITGTTFWGSTALGIAPLNQNYSLGLYPNPTTDQVTVQFVLNERSKVDIMVFDYSGRVCSEFHFSQMNSGSHSLAIPVYGLAGGQYQIVCQSGSQLISRQLIKL